MDKNNNFNGINMKKQIKSPINSQYSILIFGLFMLFSVTTIAQQNTRGQQMANRIIDIDIEMERLMHLKELINMDYVKISDFSIKARPILAKHQKYIESINETIQLKQVELNKYYGMVSRVGTDKIYQIESELNSLKAKRDKTYFIDNGGITSSSKIHCKTLEDLQHEYNETVTSYIEKKKEFEKISIELGKLNTEKTKLETDLLYMGGSGIGGNLQGCWELTTGKYVSIITVSINDKNEYVGYLGYQTENNLQNYSDGQKMFNVTHVSQDTYRGTEYTYKKVKSGGYIINTDIIIPIKITIINNGNSLIWTSDETVTMNRCSKY